MAKEKSVSRPREGQHSNLFDVIAWAGLKLNVPGTLAVVAGTLHSRGIGRERMTAEVTRTSAGEEVQEVRLLGVGGQDAVKFSETLLNNSFEKVNIEAADEPPLDASDVRIKAMGTYPAPPGYDFFLNAELPYDTAVPCDVLLLGQTATSIDINIFVQELREHRGFSSMSFNFAGKLINGTTYADFEDRVSRIVDAISTSWMAVNGRRWRKYFEERGMYALSEAPVFCRSEDLSKQGDVY